MSSFRRALVIALCAVALGACRVDATVMVRMRENGSGVVIVRVDLDRAAVRAAEIGGGKLEARVRLDDLPGAGWTVAPWQRRNGGAILVVRKTFSRPNQVGDIVAELNGEAGPLRDVRASRTTSTFSTSWKVSGSADLRAMTTGLAEDPELVANLTAERVDVPQIESRVARGLLGLRLRIVAELPDGHRQEVWVKPGQVRSLRASADETDAGRVALLAGGIGAGLLALVVLVVGERRARRRRSVRSAP